MKGIVKYDESTICLSRQEVAFWKECRKIKGWGNLKRNFYTSFIPILRILGCDMAKKMNSILVVNGCCRSAAFVMCISVYKKSKMRF